MAPITLTPVQQQIAISLGIDVSNVSAADLAKIKDAEALQAGLSSTANTATESDTKKLSSALSGTSAGSPVDGFVKSAAPLSNTTTTVTTDGDRTRYSTQTVTMSSEEFLRHYKENQAIGKDLAESCIAQNTAASEMAILEDGTSSVFGSESFHGQLTSLIAKNGYSPEVRSDLTDSDDFLEIYNPIDRENHSSCGTGVVLNYLQDSVDPHMSALAKAAKGQALTSEEAQIAGVTLITNEDGTTSISKQDQLKATRQAVYELEAMQPDIKYHAIEAQKIIDKVIAEGGTYEDGVRAAQEAGHADKFGGPIKDTDKPWIIPNSIVSKTDYEKIKGNDQSEEDVPENKIPKVFFSDSTTKGTLPVINIDNYQRGMSQVTDVPYDTFMANTVKREDITFGFVQPTSINFYDGIDKSGDGYNSLSEIAASPYREFLGDEELEAIEQGQGDQYGYNLSVIKNVRGQHSFDEAFGKIPEPSRVDIMINQKLAELEVRLKRKLNSQERATYTEAFRKALTEKQ